MLEKTASRATTLLSNCTEGNLDSESKLGKLQTGHSVFEHLKFIMTIDISS